METLLTGLKNLPAFVIVLLAAACQPAQTDVDYNIATYNIRYDSPYDSGNMWQDRAKHVIHLIKFHQLDIIGTQEGMHDQLEEMKAGLGFPYVGVGRDKGDTEGEFSAVFYDPSKFDVVSSGTFWLSDTPDVPSKGWDAALNRVCTWAKIRSKNGTVFYVFNAHYDHIGQQAREESSRLIMRKTAEINMEKLPVVLLGDFNVTPDNIAYTLIEDDPRFNDARLVSELPAYGPSGTFNGFDWNKAPDGIIDHIFVSTEIIVKRHGILTDNYGLKYPSDHFPVFINMEFKK